MESIKKYAVGNLNDLNKPEDTVNPFEDNLSGTGAAFLPPRSVGPATDSRPFIPNISCHAENRSNFGAYASNDSTASVSKVTKKEDKPLEECWYNPVKLKDLSRDLVADRYKDYLLQEGVLNRVDMDDLKELRKRKSAQAKHLIKTLQTKYENPDLCEFREEHNLHTVTEKRKFILDTIHHTLGGYQPFLRDYLNKEYVETRTSFSKSKTSSSAQGSAPVDMRNARYAAEGQENLKTSQLKQASEHDEQVTPLLTKGGEKKETNKYCNVKESFPVQETSEPPSPQLPPRFFP